MPVSELALAKELGSSRTPIREAISQLVSDGLLEQIPNRGAVVVQLTRQDVIDLYELREALEVFAAGKAARQTIQAADMQRLREIADQTRLLRDALLESGREFLKPHEMRRFINSDLGFHTLLMRLAANVRILRVVNETRLMIRVFSMRRRGHNAAELERILHDHQAIVDALARGQADLAASILTEHIRLSEQESLDEFDARAREKALNDHLHDFRFES